MLWANYTFLEATSKTEEDMKAKYLYLFEVPYVLSQTLSFEDEPFLRGEGCNGPTLSFIYLFNEVMFKYLIN